MTIDLKDFESIDDVVTQLLAREVAFGFEMARSVGYQVPVEYDVGFHRIAIAMSHGPKGERYLYRLRVNDVTYDVRVLIPHFDNRNTLAETSQLWEAAMRDLIRGANTMAHVWLDKHPEVGLAPKGAQEALAKLEAVTSDGTKELQWTREIRERVARNTFKRVRR